MNPSTWLYAFLKTYEQFRPVAYKPTPKDKWTIAWGHTNGVKEGDTCTTVQGQLWLEDDVDSAVEAINRLCNVEMTQNQFDALTSLVFNIGVGNFETSTLLRKLNAEDYDGAAEQFLVWDEQKGEEMPGLETRREAEKARFEAHLI